MSSKGNEIYSMFVQRIRDELLAELEREIEARIERYHRISTECKANENDFEADAHSHYVIEAQSLLSLIRSKKGVKQ